MTKKIKTIILSTMLLFHILISVYSIVRIDQNNKEYSQIAAQIKFNHSIKFIMNEGEDEFIFRSALNRQLESKNSEYDLYQKLSCCFLLIGFLVVTSFKANS